MNSVLIVDDSQTWREILAEWFRERRWRPVGADDGVKALSLSEQEHFDLLLLDVIMPRLNGFETCRRLKDNPRTQAIPILVMSSNNNEFDRYWALRQGADGYLGKPFSADELWTVLQPFFPGSPLSEVL
ncbi:MAG: PleD family two-component system response regulator [Cyanobacteriota bacterium]|jgi:twitching motility two-component system response regulator PilH